MSIDIARTIATTSPSVTLAERMVGTTFLTWMRRARQRRDLTGLTDRELSDMGLTEHQVTQEAAKPFWRA